MTDETRLFSDRESLCRDAAGELLRILADAVRDRGAASAVLTGGGTGTGILSALSDLVSAVPGVPADLRIPDWSRVHLWWGDERFLPAGDQDRNEQQAEEALLQDLVTQHGMPAANIHRMPAADSAAAAGTVPPETPVLESIMTAAEAYASELADHARVDGGPDERLPVFDVVMLGVGPDAHVASLFPGLPGPLTRGATVIAVVDSPKPPPWRLSLTVEALHTAERLWFVVAGADKAEAVAAVRQARDGKTTDAARWPASVVSGRDDTVWWLDEAAAGQV
ncbi:6-phosphogluconolactonase [Citricoccus sp. K5]|uniref:6-phosphogluconolactonase n=1 Tax=Citricoccus sp. K5 TaxID=2653135 RepID=UPI0012F18D96|nr:6-phosphogluconolactonase [Citricoccus sp. K5]VXB34587.1 6-phosphogluconolactonase [Citricoccus sp. K5]